MVLFSATVEIPKNCRIYRYRLESSYVLIVRGLDLRSGVGRNRSRVKPPSSLIFAEKRHFSIRLNRPKSLQAADLGKDYGKTGVRKNSIPLERSHHEQVPF